MADQHISRNITIQIFVDKFIPGICKSNREKSHKMETALDSVCNTCQRLDVVKIFVGIFGVCLSFSINNNIRTYKYLLITIFPMSVSISYTSKMI